jgi:hypothetical protein
VTNLHYRLYKSGISTNDGDVIYGFALGAALGQLDDVYLLTARDTTKVPAVETSQTVLSSSIAMAANGRLFGSPLETLYSVCKSYIGASSPSTTKALRRLSTSVSKIETSLDIDIMCRSRMSK